MEKRIENKIIEVVVRNYHVEGHTFRLCKDETNHFWGFDTKELGKGKEFNGFNGHRGETIIETMRSCYTSARVENELNAEKIRNNDIEEMKKVLEIIEDSYKVIQ